MSDKVFSTYQIAELCKVHHTTVINWMNEGVLTGYTTPGGHRRVKEGDIRDFMLKYKIPLPEELYHHKTRRILIVDDDIEFLEELREALSVNGFLIDCALNGFEAGRKIYKKRPDVVLLDFKMPGMDGFQVCRVLKSDKETRDIPVVAVTSMTAEDDVKQIKKCGVRRYFAKPLNIEKLRKFLIETLGSDDEPKKEEPLPQTNASTR